MNNGTMKHQGAKIAESLRDEVRHTGRHTARKASALEKLNKETGYLTPVFGSVVSDAAMPHHSLRKDPVEPRLAYEVIKEYLSIEGNAKQNAATFCQTYMEPEATKLMAENLEKNAIDKDEYPLTADLENRCVAILADLWNADAAESPMGTSTVGSSEA